MTRVFVVAALVVAMPGCALFNRAVVPSLVECAPDRQYLIDNIADVLDGENVFTTLDKLKREKGVEFVVCALRGFLSRVSAGPETAGQRAHARAYLHHLEHAAQ